MSVSGEIPGESLVLAGTALLLLRFSPSSWSLNLINLSGDIGESVEDDLTDGDSAGKKLLDSTTGVASSPLIFDRFGSLNFC